MTSIICDFSDPPIRSLLWIRCTKKLRLAGFSKELLYLLVSDGLNLDVKALPPLSRISDKIPLAMSLLFSLRWPIKVVIYSLISDWKFSNPDFDVAIE